jgi:broad specificity phosphatase PhoE
LKIIFVRHGSTAALESGIHQKPEEPLSKEGFGQVKRVADRLRNAEADLIISSRCRRAVQTAQVISKVTGKRVIYTNLLNEFASPSEVHGKKFGGRFAARIWKEVDAHVADPKWHYSDEENVFDLRNRALKAIEYLKSKKRDILIVVTHGNIMRMILFVGIFGKDADVAGSFYKFIGSLDLKNTAITECEMDKNVFKLVTYNDHAHLR